MKNILNNIYHRYFPEIMTGILVSLVLLIGLVVFGIYNGTSQRNRIDESTSIKLDSIQLDQKFVKKGIVKLNESDSIQNSLKKKLDIINKH